MGWLAVWEGTWGVCCELLLLTLAQHACLSPNPQKPGLREQVWGPGAHLCAIAWPCRSIWDLWGLCLGFHGAWSGVPAALGGGGGALSPCLH